MLTENLSINITPGGVPVTINISQYDIGMRTFVFSPYTSVGTFAPDSAVSATLEGTKPDGNIIVHNCAYNSTTGAITYTVQEQLAAVAGKVWSKLTLRDTGGNAIGYTAIIWVVDMAGVQDGAIASDSDIAALQAFVNEYGSIYAYKAALDGALAAVGGPYVASTVSQMTDHSKVYVYTGSQTGYTAGHWYYWNGSAWTDGGVYQATAVETDKTLSVADMAADAKVTGDIMWYDTGLLYSEVVDGNWESGLITNNIGGNSDNPNYIRTKYRRCTNALEITIAAGYKGRVAVYNENYGSAGFIGWLDDTDWTGSKRYPDLKGYQWRMRLCRDVLAEMSPSEGSENVTIRQYLADPTLTKQYAPADAKAVGDIVNVLPNTYLPISAYGVIAENDDLNDYTTPGAYKSPSTAITKTLLNCPFPHTGFLMYVLRTTSSSATEQILIHNGRPENRIYHRVYASGWSEWHVFANVSDLYDVRIRDAVVNSLPPIVTGTEKITINLMTYNCAHYEIAGSSGEKMYSDPTYIDQVRSFIMNSEVDILFLQEAEDTIDDSGLINAFDYLYKYFFLSDHNVDTDPTDRYLSSGRRKVLTRLPFTPPSTEMTSVVVPWTYRENWNGYYSWVIATLPDVGNIMIVNVHNFAHTQSEQITNRKNLLDQVATLLDNQSDNYDYFIIAGDFNTGSQADYDNLMDFCDTIGGTPANGGMIGWFRTGGTEETTYCFDNVIVSSNIRINSIKAKNVFSKLLFSDHIPVVVSLTLM